MTKLAEIPETFKTDEGELPTEAERIDMGKEAFGRTILTIILGIIVGLFIYNVK